ncbi:hypothetical protein [Streptomyces sp. NPDC058989]|uniref:hypothetical protein n=1 Tax=Streptomyces sp. NPDC058989 TaxID=3346686 RepID=UPI00368BD776
MSRSELERLARIRIEITGETLERAMAVLGGELTPPEPAPEPSPAPGHDSEHDADRSRRGEPDTDGTTDPAGATDTTGATGATGAISAGTETDGDTATPYVQRKRQRRNHLRGL